jgi:hypothetical protein
VVTQTAHRVQQGMQRIQKSQVHLFGQEDLEGLPRAHGPQGLVALALERTRQSLQGHRVLPRQQQTPGIAIHERDLPPPRPRACREEVASRGAGGRHLGNRRLNALTPEIERGRRWWAGLGRLPPAGRLHSRFGPIDDWC